MDYVSYQNSYYYPTTSTAASSSFCCYPACTAGTCNSYTIPNNACTGAGDIFIDAGYNLYPSDRITCVHPPSPPETEEQKQARLAREAEYRRRVEAAEAERIAAVKRAEELLKEHIGLDRFGVLYQVGHLDVDSQKYPGRKYRIKKTTWDRIQILENNMVVDELCVISRVDCPDGDKLLMKVVLAECDEENLLKVSHHFRPSVVNATVN